MTVALKQYQRHRHIEQMLAAERETAALLGQIEALLPADLYRKVLAGMDSQDYERRFDRALRLANRVQAMAEIVDEADRILLVGDDLVAIHGNGRTYDAVPAHWRIMTHLALTAGWCQIGRHRLERRKHG